jgi:hypothetical protein
MQSDNAPKLKELYEKCGQMKSYTLHVDTGDRDTRFTFEVKPRIGMGEAEKLVERVCNAVVEPNTGAYHPELKDYYLRMEVLKAYTNISLPDGNECWELLYGTPVFAMITGRDKCPVIFDYHEYDDNRVIDVEQYEQIVAAIEQKMAYALELQKAKELMKHMSAVVRRRRVRQQEEQHGYD